MHHVYCPCNSKIVTFRRGVCGTSATFSPARSRFAIDNMSTRVLEATVMFGRLSDVQENRPTTGIHSKNGPSDMIDCWRFEFIGYLVLIGYA